MRPAWQVVKKIVTRMSKHIRTGPTNGFVEGHGFTVCWETQFRIRVSL